MTIEKVVEMIDDCTRLANSGKETDKLKATFIKNFKNEYKIIEIGSDSVKDSFNNIHDSVIIL